MIIPMVNISVCALQLFEAAPNRGLNKMTNWKITQC